MALLSVLSTTANRMHGKHMELNRPWWDTVFRFETFEELWINLMELECLAIFFIERSFARWSIHCVFAHFYFLFVRSCIIKMGRNRIECRMMPAWTFWYFVEQSVKYFIHTGPLWIFRSTQNEIIYLRLRMSHLFVHMLLCDEGRGILFSQIDCKWISRQFQNGEARKHMKRPSAQTLCILILNHLNKAQHNSWIAIPTEAMCRNCDVYAFVSLPLDTKNKVHASRIKDTPSSINK